MENIMKSKLRLIKDQHKAVNHLIDEGKVLHIGASSMFAWQFAKSLWVAEKYGLEPFRTMQNHYNLVYREEEREMIPLCKDQGIGVICWSPLARGFLSGRYSRSEEPDSPRVRSDPNLKSRYFHPADFNVVEAVVELLSHENSGVSDAALDVLVETSGNISRAIPSLLYIGKTDNQYQYFHRWPANRVCVNQTLPIPDLQQYLTILTPGVAESYN